jgi:hypothetical protein
VGPAEQALLDYLSNPFLLFGPKDKKTGWLKCILVRPDPTVFSQKTTINNRLNHP